MILILRILNLSLTGGLALYVFLGRRRCGRGKACVLGMGFFAAALYLDYIFSLLMEAMADREPDLLLQGMGILAPKSIMAGVLIMGRVLLEPRREREKEGELFRQAEESGEAAGGDMEYLDGLTLGVSLFSLLLIPVCLDWGGEKVPQILALLFCLAVLLGFDVSVYFQGRRQQVRKRQFEEEARKHEAALYLKEVENNYQRTRELWHDLKNHINLLNLLLQEKKYGELEDYLRIFGEDVDSLTLPMKSGNLIVDALLADKLARARREKVEVTLSLCNLTELRLKPDELVGLLGNLLDNALEANAQVSEGRFLEVVCRKLEDCYYIRVRNAAAGPAREQNGALQSEKTDRKNRVGHGLGLRSVERIVHGCGGELAVDSSQTDFTAVVRLPG